MEMFGQVFIKIKPVVACEDKGSHLSNANKSVTHCDF